MSEGIRLLIAVNNKLLRDTLACCLTHCSPHQVVGKAGNGDEAVAMAEKLRPDLIFMNVSSVLDGFDAARRIQSRRPATRFVFMSDFPRGDYLEEARSLNASGYLAQSEAGEEHVLQAINDILSGRPYFSLSPTSRGKDEAAGGVFPARVSPSHNGHHEGFQGNAFSELTPRQLETLIHLGSGHSYKQIAHAMNIQPKTVDNHVTAVMKKLDIHTRGKLMAYAIREGLVDVKSL